MKVYNWSASIGFPGIFPVMLWVITSYTDLIPGSMRSLTRRLCLILLLAWFIVQLFNYRTAIFDALRKPISYITLPHFYFLIYTIIAGLSALYYADKQSILFAINLGIFVLLASLVTYLLVNQPEKQTILWIKQLWDITILLLIFRLLILFIGVILAFENAVNVINLGPIKLLRLRAEGFYGALNANTVAYLGACILVVGVNRFLHPTTFRAYWLLVSCIGIAALILGYSRTAFVALGIVGVLYLVFYQKFLWLLGIILTILISVTQFEAVSIFFMRGYDFETISTLDNRTFIWTSALRTILESPFVGYGYFSGERIMLLNSMTRYYPDELHFKTSHNAFLSVLLGNGLLGFVPFITTFILLGTRIFERFRIFRSYHGIYAIVAHELFAVFFITLISSLTLPAMLYTFPSIRNLSLLVLFVFAGLRIIPITDKGGKYF